ncbi:Na+/H+ antiporter subunit E [Starkeya sp. ORNL1]|uniref:Na+/H+ antiporter subunit E n=1 Tax=Starkeya sp. ORNL1 TaxID=2709380 RepID=UPI0014642A6A|nr:Na+/H+ antiporter subunit E [Starkeya sp. ORNL1]QJP17313.1 Na+/H+ antiporter subunit E [Starkeya sp. ORNL1]
MKRVLPYPLLFLALWAMWLLLNQSVSPGQLIFGALIAFGACWAMAALGPEPARVRSPGAVIRLAGRVAVDVVRSNIAVGRIILGLAPPNRRSGFMTVPLDLTNHYGLTVLSIVLTATPGTLWMNYDSARRELLLHVLDLVDEEEWVRLIKDRYERLLIEIFE